MKNQPLRHFAAGFVYGGISVVAVVIGFMWLAFKFMDAMIKYEISTAKCPSGEGAAVFLTTHGLRDSSAALYVDDPNAANPVVEIGSIDIDGVNVLKSAKWTVDGTCLIVKLKRDDGRDRIKGVEVVGYDFKTNRKLKRPSQSLLKGRGGIGRDARCSEGTREVNSWAVRRYLNGER